MAIEFFGTKEQQELVSCTFDEIYEQYSSKQRFTKDEAHFQPWCNIASLLLIKTLRRMGASAGLMSRKPIFGGIEANFHDFVSLGNTWIADLTWQQFLDMDKRSKNVEEGSILQPPKVLLCRMNDLPMELQKWGIKKSQLHWWTKAKLVPFEKYASTLDPFSEDRTRLEWRKANYSLAINSVSASQFY